MSADAFGDEITDEQIYAELRQYELLGVLEYVLPTEPLGEEWVLGVEGRIVKLVGKDQACGFLAGASALARWAHAHFLSRQAAS